MGGWCWIFRNEFGKICHNEFGKSGQDQRERVILYSILSITVHGKLGLDCLGGLRQVTPGATCGVRQVATGVTGGVGMSLPEQLVDSFKEYKNDRWTNQRPGPYWRVTLEAIGGVRM